MTKDTTTEGRPTLCDCHRLLICPDNRPDLYDMGDVLAEEIWRSQGSPPVPLTEEDPS